MIVIVPIDQSGPPSVIHGIPAPVIRSMPIQAPTRNQSTAEATQDETSYRQVIPNIPQQSLYPSLVAMGTSINTSVSPEMSFSRRVIQDSKTCQKCSFLIQMRVPSEEQISLLQLVQLPSRRQRLPQLQHYLLLSHKIKHLRIPYNWSL